MIPERRAVRPAVVHLARHATPDWSRKDIRYDIPPGPPLTEQGEAEARLLGAYLRDVGVAAVYASPLERTRRTAEIVGEALGLTPIEEPAIAEWRRDEPEAVVRDRFRAAWQRAAAESLEIGPVAFVTHGGPIRALLAALGMAEHELSHYRSQFDNRNPMPPAGVWSTVRDGEGEGEGEGEGGGGGGGGHDGHGEGQGVGGEREGVGGEREGEREGEGQGAGVGDGVVERGRWRMTLSFAPVPFAPPMFGRLG